MSPVQKVTAALHQLAYRATADAVDEYYHIGKTTAIECLQYFCRDVIGIFDGTYLQPPTQDDIERILHVNTAHRFPWMLGSLDCMHWSLKNCLSARRGQFTGKEKELTIVLEAVATYDL